MTFSGLVGHLCVHLYTIVERIAGVGILWEEHRHANMKQALVVGLHCVGGKCAIFRGVVSSHETIVGYEIRGLTDGFIAHTGVLHRHTGEGLGRTGQFNGVAGLIGLLIVVETYLIGGSLVFLDTDEGIGVLCIVSFDIDTVSACESVLGKREIGGGRAVFVGGDLLLGHFLIVSVVEGQCHLLSGKGLCGQMPVVYRIGDSLHVGGLAGSVEGPVGHDFDFSRCFLLLDAIVAAISGEDGGCFVIIGPGIHPPGSVLAPVVGCLSIFIGCQYGCGISAVFAIRRPIGGIDTQMGTADGLSRGGVDYDE